MSDDASQYTIAAYQRGSADPARLRAALAEAWKTAKRDPRQRADIETILGIGTDGIDHMELPPLDLGAERSGLTGGEVVLILLGKALLDVLTGAAKDLAKDAVKTKARNLWDKLLLPALTEHLMDRRPLGDEIALKPDLIHRVANSRYLGGQNAASPHGATPA